MKDYQALLDDMRDVCRKKNEELAALRAELRRVEDAAILINEDHIRISAELESLRPKPVVHTCIYGVEIGKHSNHWPEFTAGAGLQNLELIFHDGVLVDAAVIKQGGGE